MRLGLKLNRLRIRRPIRYALGAAVGLPASTITYNVCHKCCGKGETLAGIHASHAVHLLKRANPGSPWSIGSHSTGLIRQVAEFTAQGTRFSKPV